jgi:hypothetical protein
MREIFSSSDPATVGCCKSILERSGISCSIHDSGNLPLPGRAPYSAVWIVKEGDYAEAHRILESNEDEIKRFRPDWVCPSCSETNPGKIEACRNCNAVRSGFVDESIYEVLERIRSRPALYLGESTIVRLDAYLVGIITGLGMAELALRDAHDFHRFHGWVAGRLNINESASGWCRMIRSKSASDEDAMKQFFVLLDEFRKESE